MSEEASSKENKLKDLAQSLSEELGGEATVPNAEAGSPSDGSVRVSGSETPTPTGGVKLQESTAFAGGVTIPPAGEGVGIGTVSQVVPAPTAETPSDEVALDGILAQAVATPTTSAEKKDEVAAPPAVAASSDLPTLSFEELDKILKEQDPAFFDDLEKIKQDMKNVEVGHLAPIQIDSEMFKDSSQSPDAPNLLPKVPIGKKVKLKFAEYVDDTTERIENTIDFVTDTAKNAKTHAKTAATGAKAVGNSVKNAIVAFGKWFQSRSISQQIQLFLFIGILAGFSFYVKHLVTGTPLLHPAPPTYLKSFEPVATKITPFNSDEEMELFDNPLRQPEYVVLLKKMRVNLKPSSKSSRNPMAAFEVFVEASTQEGAIELKDRELEMQDVIARVFESMPYDEIIEYEGKNKLKLILRRDLNRTLSQGRVKKVYFKTLFYKP